ncbi:MAG: Omp28-related outer membrane protein [Phycisphaerales bacterium]|nr:Omp28-related outer membrane protein [Phycisphaerales bacterium]
MKKILRLGVLASILALQSCEEKDVVIDGFKNYVDTTYVTTPEVAQARNVLIEEFTGASCTNCPAGHDVVSSIISSNPGKIVAVAYHTFNAGEIFKPVNKPNGEKSAFDFRDSAATLMSSSIFGGLTSIPTAGIDRIPVGSTLQIGRNQWSSTVSSRLSVAAPANMYIKSTYNSSTNLVSLNVKIAYTSAVAKKNALTLGVIESNIIDAQEYTDSVDMHYVHNHIFRKCLTPYYGNAILDNISTKQPGRVYEYNYQFTPSSTWKLENCSIVGFLSTNESSDKEVLQAIEVKLK